MDDTVLEEQAVPVQPREVVEPVVEGIPDTAGVHGELVTETIHTEDAAHANSAGMPQMDPTWMASQLFWLAFTFILLYAALARIVIPRIRETLENRETRISHDLDQARQLQEDAEAARVEFEKALDESQEGATSLINRVQDDLAAMAVQSHKELDSKLTKQLLQADVRIANSVEEAHAKLRPVVAELCNEIVKAVINETVNEDDAANAVDKATAA